jgi:small-conductance mechanosensitive channel
MKSRHSIYAILLVTLLALVGYGLFATSRRDPAASVVPAAASLAPSTQRLADESALNTVLELLKLPVSADESPLAEDALHLADKDMDLAFADAVQSSSVQSQTLTPQVRAIEARLAHVQDDLAADDAQIAELTAAATKATGARRAAVNDELALARARLELDRDGADDAKQDLIRAGGDPQGRMQAVLDEHEASSKRADSTRIVITSPSAAPGMLKRIGAWWSLRQKELQLANAKTAAATAATKFAAQHAAMEHTAPQNAAVTDTTSVGHSPADSVRRRTAGAGPMSHEASAALLRKTVRLDAEQKARGRLDQHAENQRALATAYERWVHVVRNDERTAINRVLRSVMGILVILLLALLIDRYIEHLLRTVSSDRRRTQTMCMVVRVSLQIMAVLFALLVIFGMPNNLGTFLGLAGAGLTVALKDFIISFFGWFVLLGKDGIGIGDLVEINGVTGEVVELGMFHSVLLETGNWTESGHLTGRRVTFTNSFAIEGHYFNFSTSGQWLWDQVNIVVPAGRDPYPIVDALQRHVEAATADSAEKAEREWKGTPRSRRFSAVAAAPAINIKPVIGGTEVTVRFLTHVRQRSELRSDLYHTAVDLLGEKPVAGPQHAGIAG